MGYRLKCRKQRLKENWSCRVVHNGNQKGNFGVNRAAMGYTLTPFDNFSCGMPFSVTMNQVLSALNSVLKSGTCAVPFQPIKVTKDKRMIGLEQDYACVMDELKAKLKLKEMKKSGKK